MKKRESNNSQHSRNYFGKLVFISQCFSKLLTLRTLKLYLIGKFISISKSTYLFIYSLLHNRLLTTLTKKHFENIMRKKRKSCNQHFLLFLQYFLPYRKHKSLFELHLTHYHTMLQFDTLKIYSCGKHCEKRRNCL